MKTPSHPSFGRLRRVKRHAIDAASARAQLASGKVAPNGLLGYGNGKSYGDSCHNDPGLLAEVGTQRRILGFDPQHGVIDVEAGTLLATVIAHAAPSGWFLPVTPGTQFVTVGGAIANDVHGKNHHRRGAFGAHVESLTLMRSDGSIRTCSRQENDSFFSATIGGMGLTGLILTARIRLMKIGSLNVIEEVKPFSAFAEFLDLANEADARNEYAVSWIDQLSSHGGRLKGVLLTGNHADDHDFDGARREARLAVPFQPPVTLLNRPFLRLFNAAYAWSKARQAGSSHVTGWRSFFYPLDGVRDWNRLYGPRGLFQHQSVIPVQAARAAVPALLEAAHRAGQGSFLTVLKRFGDMPQNGLMSFARPGYTLTLDFPNRGEKTLRLLDELDRITVDAGGAVNPYKDARMSAATFEASFPGWRALEAMRDPAFCSDFWRRTALALEPQQSIQEAAE